MGKFLLSLIAFSPVALMAAPQGPLYMSGLNSTDVADSSVALVLDENRSEDDIDEGVWRYTNPKFSLSEAGNFKIVSSDKSFSLGYDPDNFMGASNSLSNTSPMMYLKGNGEPIDCSCTAGSYSVTLVLFEADPEDAESSDAWMLQFQSLDAPKDTGNFYLLGFGGESEEPSSSNKFVKEVIEEDGETFISYSIPKFHVSACPDGFRVMDADAGVYYGADGEVSAEMPFSMLSEDGPAVKSSLPEGYYTVNFSAMAGFSMISFILCEDQIPADGSEYYLLGFNGVSAPEEAMKFTRKVSTEEYEDEGDVITETVISYVLENVVLDECPDGFTVATADGGFSFGVDPQYSAIFGETVTSDMGLGFLAIYGAPMGWAMEPGAYNVIFNLSSGASAMISFIPYEDSRVEGIIGDAAAPVEYFNLQGVRVQNPGKGIFVKRQGSKVSKVVIR